MNESIEAAGLTKIYRDGDRELQVLKKISLAVPKGEGVAILGPSGSGKTTLLNILAGLDRPNEGEVFVEGVSLGRLNDSAKARFRNKTIGVVFQFYHLLHEFSALENVMLPALIGREFKTMTAVRTRAERLLEAVGLKDRMRHFPSEMSGGEQQRAAIARALVNDPAVVFCDEPTGNLDAETGLGIIEILKGLFSAQKKTVLIVTHDERIAKMADRVFHLATAQWSVG